MKKEDKNAIQIILLLLACTFLYILIIAFFKKQIIMIMFGLSLYAISLYIMNKLIKKTNSTMLKQIINIYSIPLSLILFMSSVIEPTILLLRHTIFYIIIALSPLLILMYFVDHFEIFELSIGSQIFISLTIGTIISVVLNKTLLKLINTFLPVSENKIQELIENTLTPKIIRLTIYGIYFLYLGVFSIMYLEDKSFFISQKVDFAVLHAFLVFLAFDNLIKNLADYPFNPIRILFRLLAGIFNNTKD